jgi:chromate transporter
MKKLIQLYVSWFKMGLFTFGGGYAMLPMIQKEVIEKYHWATEDEVMDYYAIGQCTPGVIAVNTSKLVFQERLLLL